MRRPLAFCAFALLWLASSCSESSKDHGDDDDDDDGTTQPLLATSVGAVAVGVSKAADGGVAANMLVGLDASGTATAILDAPSEQTWDVVLAGDSIVAWGTYTGVLASDGTLVDCYLIAFPVESSSEPVRCLSLEPVGNRGSANDPFGQQPGVISREDAAFFAIPQTGANKSELRRWTAGSSATELLVQLEATDGNRFYTVFADPEGTNVCGFAPMPQSGSSGAPGKLVCGDPDIGSYSVADLGSELLNANIYRVNRTVATHEHLIDLATLTTAPISRAQLLPRSPDSSARTPSDGVVGINFQLKLVNLDSAGVVSLIDDTQAWERLFGAENVAFAYGGSQLRRLDLATATLSTNLLGAYSLLQVTDLSLGGPGLLRIDGVAGSGQPAVVLVDTSSGALSATRTEIPRLQSVIELQ